MYKPITPFLNSYNRLFLKRRYLLELYHPTYGDYADVTYQVTASNITSKDPTHCSKLVWTAYYEIGYATIPPVQPLGVFVTQNYISNLSYTTTIGIKQ